MDKKRMTAHNVSVGADTEQSNAFNKNIIPDLPKDSNSFEQISKQLKGFFDINRLHTVSMTELYDTVYQSKPPVIDGLLYPGTYIFAGPPKLGKSFLMAQVAYHISAGTDLWNYPTRKGTVLYLALEDDYRRLQERLYRMFGAESVGDLHFAVSAGKLGEGLDGQLDKFINEHPDTKLIIIDTLQKVRDVGGENYSYANDYQIITQLKKFTDKHGICMILVHHTRKQTADDKFDMISGTNGLLGAADGGFILTKEKRTSNAATLEISGRDQPDQKLYLTRNTETLLWELDKVETELWKAPPEPIVEKLSEFITENNPRWQGTATELVEVLGLDLQPNTLTMKLNINASALKNEYNIYYQSSRSHAGRRIELSFQQGKA